jgi:hypothetical protein
VYDLDDFDELSVDKKDKLINTAHESTHISWHRMSIRWKIMSRNTKIVKGYLTEAKPISPSTKFIISNLRLYMLMYFYFHTNMLYDFYSSIVR